MQLSKCLTTEPWACSSAPRWSHPGVVVDNNTHSGFLSPVCFVKYCSRGCCRYRKSRFTKIFCLYWTINNLFLMRGPATKASRTRIEPTTGGFRPRHQTSNSTSDDRVLFPVRKWSRATWQPLLTCCKQTRDSVDARSAVDRCLEHAATELCVRRFRRLASPTRIDFVFFRRAVGRMEEAYFEYKAHWAELRYFL